MHTLLLTLCRLALPLALASALGSAFAATHTITMLDAPPYFDQPNLEVKVGDTVTWSNTGPELAHIVMDGDLNLYSQDIVPGKSWSYKFAKPGVYDYICHRHFFMKARVTVRDESGSTAAALDFPYQKAFREFVIPTMRSVPRMIIAGQDHRMWFTEGGGDFYGFEDIPAQNKIASIDEHGRVVEYATPTPDSDGSKVGVDSLVMDKKGHIYFTERLTNRIGVLSPSGAITEHQIPTPGGYALGVDIDASGKIWFAERFGNRIGHIDAKGKITEIELPDKESEPRTIFVDTRGRIWYTARVANEIGWYDPADQQFHRLQIPTKQARPAGIAEAPDGTIYFVEMVGNKVAKVVGDQIVEYALPTAFAAPFKIVPDQNGHLWFTEVYANQIGKFDLATGEITEYKIPTVDSRPGGIAVDAKGRVWFTQQMGNKIAYFDPAVKIGGASTGVADATSATPAAPPAAKPAAPAASPPAARSEATPAVPKPQAAMPDSLQMAKAMIDYKIPSAGGGPGNTLVAAADGWLWFPLMFGNKVAAIHQTTKEFREVALPRPVSMPVGLASAGDGVMWVAEFRGNALARIDMATAKVDEFPVPWANALPSAVVVDETGAVWMSLMGENAIVRFDSVTSQFTRHALPLADSNPLYLLHDGHGNLWVSAAKDDGSYVARFDRAQQQFQVYMTTEAGANPTGMLLDGSGLWVAEGGSGHLSRLDPVTGGWARYRIPGAKPEPVRLARDAEGRIWIADGGEIGSVGGNQLAVFQPSTARFTTLPMANGQAKPMGIYAGGAGGIWFTQQGANRISLIPTDAI